MHGNEITVKEYDPDAQTYVDGPTVYVRDVAASIRSAAAAAELLADMVNGGGFSRGRGRRVGRVLHEAHNAIQRLIVSFAVGILEGLAEIPDGHLDARNAAAIDLARKIAHIAENY